MSFIILCFTRIFVVNRYSSLFQPHGRVSDVVDGPIKKSGALKSGASVRDGMSMIV